MPQSRRRFLARTTAGLVGAAAVARRVAAAPDPTVTPPPAGMPPVFGTAPPVGPEITPATIVEAQKLVRIEFTPRGAAADRGELAPGDGRDDGAAHGPAQARARGHARAGHDLEPDDPGVAPGPTRDRFVGERDVRGRFRGTTRTSRSRRSSPSPAWIESRALTSERLTRIYIERIERLDAKLRSVITLTKDVALAQAKRADAEIAGGKYRGPLHGIPFGVKDLLDTKGILTTCGAEPYRNRVPEADSVVVDRLQNAGAVLLAKLSLGALALNDVWFGGQTMNPWLLEEGSGGIERRTGRRDGGARSWASRSAARRVDRSSIPAVRCGVAGLRPTFGKVPRTGAMTLCWTLDKLGPMTHGVEDAMLVLQAISGPDPGDLSSVPSHLDFDANRPGQRSEGRLHRALDERGAGDGVDRAALETMKKLGMTAVAVELPDWPYDSLNTVLFAEGAAAFEELTLSGRHGSAQDAGPGRLAQPLPTVAFPVGRRLRPGRPHAPQGRAGDGARLREGGRAPRRRRCAARS